MRESACRQQIIDSNQNGMETGIPIARSWANQEAMHRTPSQACSATVPQAVQDFADQLVKMQRLRHLADYDPLERFVRSEVSQLVEQTESVIAKFKQAERPDRRAFAVFVLFNLRRD